MYITKRGSHRAIVTLLGTHVAFDIIRSATLIRYSAVLNGTERLSRWHTVRKILSWVKIVMATNFAAWCSKCKQIVAKYVNVESSVEKFLQITKCYKITSSTLSR